ncbi:MAG: VCBS repeat-containing protein [Planctomycetes bacterium]|nr:VCBS repeat-containing protein [Planctomycetota bacterium]
MPGPRAAVLTFPLILTLSMGVAIAQDFQQLGRSGLAPELVVDWRVARAGDLDGDGDLDQLLACFGAAGSGDRSFWLSNDGTGWFERMPDSFLQLAPSLSYDVALADFDGDGDLDALFANQTLDTLCRNDGSGVLTLSLGDLPALTRETRALAVGDVDGDGDLDVVGGCGGFDVLYLNDGNGVFGDGSGNLPASWDLTTGVDLGDYDGDGDLDLLRVNQDASSELLRNDGTGHFGDPTPAGPSGTSVAAGDLDGDGDRDFVIDTYFAGYPGAFFGGGWMENDGAGNFVYHSLPTPYDLPRRSVVVDYDGDGDLDILAEGLGVLQNDGHGNFTPVGDTANIGSFYADIDGDGDADRIGIPTLRNDGDGNFLTPPTASQPITAVHAIADMNGDGMVDLIADSLGYVRVLGNDGYGAFPNVLAQLPPSAVTVTWNSTPWGTFDLNGDGLPDVVPVGNDSYFENVAGAGLVPHALAVPVRRPVALDVDGDGDLDLLTQMPVGSGAYGGLAWMPNQAGSFAMTVLAGVAWADPACAADLDGDGRVDAIYLLDGQVPAWSRVTGAGTFTAMPALPGVAPASCVAAADLDGDGDQDLLIGNNGMLGWGERLTILENRWPAPFVVAAALLPPNAMHAVEDLVPFDADGDGDLDVAVRPYLSSNRTLLLRNDGEFAFTDVTGDGAPWRGLVAGAELLTHGDLDADGDLDLVSGASMLSNLQRQLFARELPTLGATWRLQVVQRPVGASLGAVVVGRAALSPAVPTPFGPLRVDPSGAAVFGPVALTTFEPVTVFEVAVPDQPVLLGVELFAQHVVIDDAGVRLFGAVRGVVHE